MNPLQSNQNQSTSLQYLNSMLNNDAVPIQQKLVLMQHIGTNCHSILLQNMQQMSQNDIFTGFEGLVDCLIYHILKHSNSAQQSQASKFASVSSQQPQSESL